MGRQAGSQCRPPTISAKASICARFLGRDGANGGVFHGRPSSPPCENRLTAEMCISTHAPMTARTGRRAPYASDPAESRGRLFDEPASPTRTEFERDRDRVIHSTRLPASQGQDPGLPLRRGRSLPHPAHPHPRGGADRPRARPLARASTRTSPRRWRLPTTSVTRRSATPASGRSTRRWPPTAASTTTPRACARSPSWSGATRASTASTSPGRRWKGLVKHNGPLTDDGRPADRTLCRDRPAVRDHGLRGEAGPVAVEPRRRRGAGRGDRRRHRLRRPRPRRRPARRPPRPRRAGDHRSRRRHPRRHPPRLSGPGGGARARRTDPAGDRRHDRRRHPREPGPPCRCGPRLGRRCPPRRPHHGRLLGRHGRRRRRHQGQARPRGLPQRAG